MADPFRQSSRSLPRNIHEPRIIADLIEHRQRALRLWQQFMIQIRFELQQRIIYSQAVISHPARKQHDVLLLPR
jgi:hypothetical protein